MLLGLSLNPADEDGQTDRLVGERETDMQTDSNTCTSTSCRYMYINLKQTDMVNIQCESFFPLDFPVVLFSEDFPVDFPEFFPGRFPRSFPVD